MGANQSSHTNDGKEITEKSSPPHNQPKPQHPNQQRQGKKNFKIPPIHEAKDLTLKDCEEIIKNSKTKKKSYKKKK